MVDFYNEYVNEGGQVVGGYCAVVAGVVRPGALALVLVGVALAWTCVRRKRRGRWFWLIPLVGTLATRQAMGQAVFHDGSFPGLASERSDADASSRSPRSMAMEFRLGPYTPDREYAHVDASGLGMGNRLHVGDNTWSAGLLLEF